MPPPADDRAGTRRRGALRNSRPLRFLAMILLLWAGMRIAFIGLRGESAGEEETPARHADRPAPRPPHPALVARMQQGLPPKEEDHTPAPAGQEYARRVAAPSRPVRQESPPHIVPPALLLPSAPVEHTAAEAGQREGAATPPPAPPTAAPWLPKTESQPGRWMRSAWLLWREKAGSPGLGNGGQLGGAQAGIRVDRLLGSGDRPAPLSLYGRLSGGLRAPVAPEAALGIATRPLSGRVPLSIGLERRIALDGDARNAFAATIVTGLNPTRLAEGVMAEGYMQAGIVGLSRTDPFVDGRLSLTATLDGEDRAAGIALSGGAQPGVLRLDIGPALHLRRPLGMKGARLLLEWRQRVAGRAAPGSGPAVTLASDF